MLMEGNGLVSVDGWITAVGHYVGWSVGYQYELARECFEKLKQGPAGTYLIVDDGEGERIYTTKRIMRALTSAITDEQLTASRLRRSER